MSSEQQNQPEKRTRLRGEERRALMLQNAKRIFARSTYAEASTGELARESDVTEPMLYKHFGSKKGLFLAVLKEYSAKSLDELQERIARRMEKGILHALEYVVDDYCGSVKADPETQRVLFQAVSEAGDPEIARCVSGHNRKIYGCIRQLVERASEEGYLDSAISLDAAAWGYMSMILALQYSVMLEFSSEVSQAQKEASRILLRGLLAQEG